MPRLYTSLEHLSVFSFRFFCPSPDILRQCPTGRCAEHSQQSFRGFFDIVSVAGDYAAGAIVNAVHNKPPVAVRGLHFHLSPKGKAPSDCSDTAAAWSWWSRQVDILRCTQLHSRPPFYISDRSTDICMTAQHIFRLQRQDTRILFDDVRPIDQFFIPTPTVGIVAADRCLCHGIGKPGSDNVSPKSASKAMIPAYPIHLTRCHVLRIFSTAPSAILSSESMQTFSSV